MWTRLARQLAESGLGSIRLDYHGMGDSSGQALEWTMEWESELFPQVVAAANMGMAALGVDRVAAVGNCGGARLALHLAGELPGSVGALCLLLTVLEDNSLTTVQRRVRFTKLAKVIKSVPLLRRVLVKALRNRRPAWNVKAFLPGYFARALGRGGVRVLYGERDREYSPRVHAALLRIVAQLPVELRARFDLQVVPGVELGGFESVKAQELVIDAAVAWLTRAFGASRLAQGSLDLTPEVAPR
jgi:pimeloyl-ACP methyl ester carboxylesterase